MDRYSGFADFVAARTVALSRLAYLLTGEHGAAEDLLQDALAKTVVHWSRVSRYDSPEAFVRRVMYHHAVSGWRRLRRRREYLVADPPDGGPDRSDESAGTVRRIVLEQALARLTPRQRAVLVLRYFEDRSPDEAAGMLGCSVGTVKSQTNHALRRLRELAPELAELTREKS